MRKGAAASTHTHSFIHLTNVSRTLPFVRSSTNNSSGFSPTTHPASSSPPPLPRGFSTPPRLYPSHPFLHPEDFFFFKSPSKSPQHHHIVPTYPSLKPILYSSPGFTSFYTSDSNSKVCDSGTSCATTTGPDAGIVMKSSHSLCLMSGGGGSGWRVLGRRAPSEILFAGSLVYWSAPMEPWDRVVGSRTVPDARMVIGRKAGALASSRRRVMFRRKSRLRELDEMRAGMVSV